MTAAPPLPVQQLQHLNRQRLELNHLVMRVDDDVSGLYLVKGERVRAWTLREMVDTPPPLAMQEDHPIHRALEEVQHHRTPRVVERARRHEGRGAFERERVQFVDVDRVGPPLPQHHQRRLGGVVNRLVKERLRGAN